MFQSGYARAWSAHVQVSLIKGQSTTFQSRANQLCDYPKSFSPRFLPSLDLTTQTPLKLLALVSFPVSSEDDQSAGE